MTIKTITDQLAAVFSAMDAKVSTESQVWVIGRRDALVAFCDGPEYAEWSAKGIKQLIARKHAICHGKGWYDVFEGRNATMIQEYVAKDCARIAKSRDASIAKKLEKVGITEVVSSNFVHTNDGFNGIFVVGTDAGKKVVTISTVYAGGHNVQCLHLRVLVNVK